MKKQFYFLLSLLLFFVFAISGCEEKDDDPTCEETAMPEITRGFSIDINVYFADSVPWEGLVTMKFHKEYCSGEISGEHTFTDFCDDDGNFYPDAIPTYKFANKYDKVFVYVEVVKNDGSFDDDQLVYYYEDVKPLLLGVEETYEWYLSWASWQK